MENKDKKMMRKMEGMPRASDMNMKEMHKKMDTEHTKMPKKLTENRY